ncbi:META domain-containing protein [Phytoactinopolyspora limicola]|uniref:META domain-containing protein n=1 Tax=Phytoactinopolyspora limicola TaxID=2715536 RepID=UPI00140A28E6|nr:META domain-containing protein [Phytoactinopolyspora limicola]
MRTTRYAAGFALAALLLAGCGGDDETDGDATGDGAIDGEWELTEGTGPGGPLPLADDYRVTLTIDGTQIGGVSACNHYGATASRDGDTFAIAEIESTAMGCEPTAMDLEVAYHEALRDVATATREGDVLVLAGPLTDLRFTEIPPVPTAELVGTEWLLDTLIDGEVASSVGGDPATLLLAADGSLTATTGCRELIGQYTEAGGEVVVTELAVTDQLCPDELQAQDEHVIDVIGDGFQADVEGDRLTLTSTGGLGLVYHVTL